MRLADHRDRLGVHGGVDVGHRLGLVAPRHRTGLPGQGLLGLAEDPLQLRLVIGERLLGVLHRDVAAADERPRVELADRLLGVDDLVHLRVGHLRVVALVVPAPAVAHHVDDDVLAELLPVGEGQLRDLAHRLRVVPVDVEDRRLDHPGHVRAVQARPRVGRGRGEADLVVDHHVHGAAGAVAPKLGEVQRLGHHALARERGVAVDRHRQHREAVLAEVQPVLLGADYALQHRVDRLQVRGVGRDRHDGLALAVRGGEPPLHAQVVLDVARTPYGLRVDVPLELGEDLRELLADDVRQHVQPAAVGHADDDLVELGVGRRVQDLVEQRDERLAAFEAEALLPHELRLEERLERLGGVEAAEDVLLLLDLRLLERHLDAPLEPLALLGVLDVHVLHAHAAAVGVAQHAEDVAQLHALLAGEAADREGPVQVPQRQPVREHVEVRVVPYLVVQRVRVGHEVAAHPVGVYQLDHAGVLVDLALVRLGDVADPAHRLVGDEQAAEDRVEEVVAEQQLVQRGEELAGLGALDDAVVVRRGHRHDLRDAQVGEGLVGGPGELGGHLHGADADDEALALHQPRDGVDGADAARVGQRQRRPGVVLHRELVAPRLADQVLVGVPELAEVHRLAVLDRGHDQGPRAVGLGEVDRQAQVDVLGGDDLRPAVRDLVGGVHARVGLDGLDQRVADQVREGDLPALAALEVVVDDHAVVEQQLRRNGAHGGRRRDLQRRLHVLGDLGRHAFQGFRHGDIGGACGLVHCGVRLLGFGTGGGHRRRG